MNTLPVTKNLHDYFNYVNSVPLLSFEEEQDLAFAVYNNNDLFAAQKLIIPYLRLVVSIAKKHSNYGLPIHDLIQEGNIGLIIAVEKFDPNMGNRLASFATIYIKNHIYEYVLNNFKPIKIATTKALRKAFFNIRKLRTASLNPIKEAEREEIAKKLDISVKDVHVMEERLTLSVLSESSGTDDDSNEYYNNTIQCVELNPEESLIESQYSEFIECKIMGVIEVLSDRDKDIILSRKFSEKAVTLSVLSDKYNISIERVRQLESNTIKKFEDVVKGY